MNIQAPISSIMTTDLMVVQAEDKVVIVRDIMDVNEIHHVPVVNFNKLVGLISGEKTETLQEPPTRHRPPGRPPLPAATGQSTAARQCRAANAAARHRNPPTPPAATNPPTNRSHIESTI